MHTLDGQMIEVSKSRCHGWYAPSMHLSLGILSRSCTANTAYIEMPTILCLVTVLLKYYELRCVDSPRFSRDRGSSQSQHRSVYNMHMAAQPHSQHSMMSEQFKGFPDGYDSTFLVYIDPSPMLFISVAHLVDGTKGSLPPKPNGRKPTDIGATSPS